MPTDQELIRAYGVRNIGKVAEALSAGRAVMLPAGAAPADDAGMPRSQPETAPDLELTPPPDAKIQRRRAKEEWLEQCAYFRRVNACLEPDALARGLFVARPEWPGADMIYAVTNSNVAGAAIGGQLKAAGLRRGIPDINVDVARGAYCGLRIELKRPAGVLSDVDTHQTHTHERFRDQGFRVAVAFGWREAWAVTCDYLGWGDANQA